jgi:hypothetical protein
MKRVLSGLVGIASLAACATPPPPPVYNPVLPYEGAGVSSLTIMADPVPERAVGLDIPTDYSALTNNAINQAMYAVPGASPAAAGAGGLIGVLIVAAIEASIDAARNNQINSFLEARGIDPRAVFAEALRSELTAQGYTVALGDQPRPAPRALFAPEQARAVNTDASVDGLQIVPGRGWAPTVVAEVVVREAGTGRVLMRDSVVQGMPEAIYVAAPYYFSPLNGDALIVPYDPMFVFADVNAAVGTRGDDGARAMEASLRQVAVAVARLIRRHAAASPETTPANGAEIAPTEVTPQTGQE